MQVLHDESISIQHSLKTGRTTFGHRINDKFARRENVTPSSVHRVNRLMQIIRCNSALVDVPVTFCPPAGKQVGLVVHFDRNVLKN